uniref:uncharacterized protein LOC122589486 n=1 Tax=Erigeron canadensis TaxID=72917 RepID=UPI001CB97AFD|nr:uncharacterized protein LOC122589486 [Erigeron canadensis]
MDIELNDWEVLTATDDDSNPVIQNPPSSYLEGIEYDSQGIIKADYFSLDSHIKYPSLLSSSSSPASADDVTDQISVASDNPSWVDPVNDNSYTKSKPVSGFWSSDCSSDDDVIKFVEPGSEPEPENSEHDCNAVVAKETGVISCGNDEIEKLENSVKMDGQKETGGGDDNSGVVVWWKLPIDLLRFCLFKASPVWSISVAAAMMGVVILGRRLYKMKRKTRTLQLKVAVDDKKVSQVMSRAAKLNEAFSVVKRSPIIRPQLPATGIAPWPMMAIR